VVFTEADFRPGGGDTGFAFRSDSDEAGLFSVDAGGNLTGYAHGFSFGAAEAGVSFGRYVTSTGEEHFVPQAAQTFGAANAGPKVGPVVINEIMYRPPDAGTNENSADEFIELLNISGASVPLYDPSAPTNTWKLTEGVDFTFPTSLTLAAGEVVLVVNFNPTDAATLAAFRARYGVPAGVKVFGPYGGQLDNSGERVELKKPNAPVAGNVSYPIVDEVDYRDSAPWPAGADGFGLSLQRINAGAYGNDPSNWQASTPTAGASSASGGTTPAITAQPADQSVLFGGEGLLSVSATGTPPLLYQWRLNGTNLADGGNFSGVNTPTLMVTNIDAQHRGDYTALVTDANDSASSLPATLTVLILPTIVVHPQPATAVQGDFVTIRPKHVMTHDNTGAVIPKFKEIFKGTPVGSPAPRMHDPRQPVFAIDHDIQNKTPENLGKYAKIESFANEHGVDFYPAGTGISHQVMVEQGYVTPGSMVVGSDSHSNLYGALCCLGTPVVRTDAASIWATGVTWWQVPPVARCVFKGKLRPGVTGKDVIVTLCGLFNKDEVLNHAVEFVGAGGKPVETGTFTARTTGKRGDLAKGEFRASLVEIPECTANPLSISVRAPGYEEALVYDVKLKPDEAKRIELTPAAATRLRLVSTVDGKPVAGAKVRFFNKTAGNASAGPYPMDGMEGPVWTTSTADGMVVLDSLQRTDPHSAKLGDAVYFFYIESPGLAPRFLGPVKAGKDLGDVAIGPLLEVRGEIRGTPEELKRFAAEWDQPFEMTTDNPDAAWLYAVSKGLETKAEGGKLTFRLTGLRPGKLRIIANFGPHPNSVSHTYTRRDPKGSDIVVEFDLKESRTDLVVAAPKGKTAEDE
jgi:hypothetical protein